MFDGRHILRASGVQEHDACGIRRISICNQREFLFRICGANSLRDSNGSRQGFTGMGEMIGPIMGSVTSVGAFIAILGGIVGILGAGKYLS